MAQNRELSELGQLITVDPVANTLLVSGTITVGNSTVNASINSTSLSINSTATNNFTVGTASYFVANGNFGIGNNQPAHTISVNGTAVISNNLNVGSLTSSATTISGFTNSGSAVFGQAVTGWGVYGYSNSSYGVYGVSNTYHGVHGYSTTGWGGYFESVSYHGLAGLSNAYYGVYGESKTSYGVLGTHTGVGGIGVYGTSPNNYAIRGDSVSGIGATGISSSNYGVYGVSNTAMGVVGQSTSNWGGYFNGAYPLYCGNTSTEMFRINNDGNVGIGTSSPGSYGALAVIRSANNTTTSRIHVGNANTGAGAEAMVTLGNDYSSGGAVAGLKIKSAAHSNSNQYEIFNNIGPVNITSGGTSAIYIPTNGGSVGIGTTTPAVTLDVVGTGAQSRLYSTSNAAAAWTQFRVGSATGYVGLDNSTGGSFGVAYGLTLWNSSAAPIMFATSGVERMRIDAAGSVMIGTGSRGYDMNSGYPLGLVSNSATQSFISVALKSQTLDTQGIIFGLDTAAGYVWLRDNKRLGFGTNDSEKMTIAANGNVGIGTVSPSQNFVINGNRPLYFNSNGGGYMKIKAQAGGWIMGSYFQGSAGTDYGGFGAAGTDDTLLYYWLGEGAASANSITIKGANVGIGTSNPSGRLHLNSYAADLIFKTHESTSAYSAQMGVDDTGVYIKHNSSIRNIRFGNTASDWVTFAANGNVGVGTSSPGVKIDTTGDIRATGGQLYLTTGTVGNALVRYSNLGGSAYVGLDSSTAGLGLAYGLHMYHSGAYPIVLSTNGTSQVIVTASGSVGIGNTSPSYKLHVTGGDSIIYSQSTYAAGRNYLTWANSSAQHGYIGFGSTDTSMQLYNYTASSLDIGTNNASRIFITSGGNVGIGAGTSPSEKLHVAGRIMATGSNYVINPAGPIFGQYTSTVGYVQAPNNGIISIWDSGTTSIADFGSGYARIGMGGANTLYVSSTGVGVGSPPSYKFQVSGTTSGDVVSAIYNYSATGYGLWIQTYDTAATRYALGVANTTGTQIYFFNNGTATFNGAVTVASITESSSITLKENISNLDNPTNALDLLQGVTYNRIGQTRKEVGLIAEEVFKVLPDIVTCDADGNPAAIQYSKLSVYLLECIKGLKAEIEELKSK